MIGNIQAVDCMPILRMRPALIASRKSAPPASAARELEDIVGASFASVTLIAKDFEYDLPPGSVETIVTEYDDLVSKSGFETNNSSPVEAFTLKEA
jgi:hypothetical protein